MINFHYLDELLSIQIDVAFYFNSLSDTPDCFHAEVWIPQHFQLRRCILAYLSHRLRVSCCLHSMSVVDCASLSIVLRVLSTIASNISSETARPRTF